jgi:NitT/TauT family transport system substrate-binding protein
VRKGIPLSKTATVTPELLKSLRYDSNTTGQSAYILELLLQQYGLSLGDLTINDVGDAAVTLEVMKQGGLDFSAMIEPWITQARSTGAGDLWLSYNDVAPEAQLAVIAYGPTILKDNPEAGERFMVAYLKAVRRFDEGMTESTLMLLEKVLELDHSLLSEMCPPFIPPDGMINAQSIVDFGEWAAAKDLIDAPVTTEMFWEPRFIEYANRQLKDSD